MLNSDSRCMGGGATSTLNVGPDNGVMEIEGPSKSNSASALGRRASNGQPMDCWHTCDIHSMLNSDTWDVEKHGPSMSNSDTMHRNCKLESNIKFTYSE